ncbi:putative branched-chain-amino-acid aminotransferase TOXF [Neolecta irregularis DAH-3]|uniref:Putative branched-chain-amino-acid aminotransferase TOXF n=1 Tax=Neolecta irregularis (strain DAH-3) TaxID=1198029 RepID=A0A1U7LW00_NEOID|nr:putative branched-chain-amino-acid aminotransferase TOXF [Neolecta irregularis DAH-3]|eukprot:OLL26855.1 putative branched-chain-amino-acid aminotransferase TOXF [Neolecta irregularis DAH-3]
MSSVKSHAVEPLGFGITPVNGHVQADWKDGKWGQLYVVKDPYLKIHGFAPCLNYGQQCFEGLKAFRQKDGRVRVCRPADNCARMQQSADMISIPAIPENMFLQAIEMLIKENIEFCPPYGHGESCYIRPLLLGTEPCLKLDVSEEFTFVVLLNPVGLFYPPFAFDALVVEDFDRSAPLGTGAAKLGGNYPVMLGIAAAAKAKGYGITLHLDSKTRTYIDEFSTSNFLAIKKGPGDSKVLIVPESKSILKSITTKSLIQIAKSFGWSVESRLVPWDEVHAFDEVAACGTAVVITHVKSITKGGEKINIGDGTLGRGFAELHARYTAIQQGDYEDSFGFMWPKEGIP